MSSNGTATPFLLRADDESLGSSEIPRAGIFARRYAELASAMAPNDVASSDIAPHVITRHLVAVSGGLNFRADILARAAEDESVDFSMVKQ